MPRGLQGREEGRPGHSNKPKGAQSRLPNRAGSPLPAARAGVLTSPPARRAVTGTVCTRQIVYIPTNSACVFWFLHILTNALGLLICGFCGVWALREGFSEEATLERRWFGHFKGLHSRHGSLSAVSPATVARVWLAGRAACGAWQEGVGATSWGSTSLSLTHCTAWYRPRAGARRAWGKRGRLKDLRELPGAEAPPPPSCTSPQGRTNQRLICPASHAVPSAQSGCD